MQAVEQKILSRIYGRGRGWGIHQDRFRGWFRRDQYPLEGKRAAYGQEVVKALADRLTAEFGRGWSEKQLRHCLRLAETFPDETILSALRRELSWTHIKTLIYVDDALKRDFYVETCRIECWSSRRLQERMQAKLHQAIESARQRMLPGGET